MNPSNEHRKIKTAKNIPVRKILTSLYVVMFVLSTFTYLYEVLDVETKTISRYVDDRYQEGPTYTNDGVMVDPGETEKRYANVPWYGFTLGYLSAYIWLGLCLMIPVMGLITIIVTIFRWKEVWRWWAMYIPILLFAIYAVTVWGVSA